MIKNVFIQNLTEWLNETFISLKDSLLLGDLSKAALALHWNTRLLLCLNKHFYLWSCSWGLVWLIHLRCCMRSTSSWARSRRCGRGSMQPPLQTRWKTAARRSFWPANSIKHVFIKGNIQWVWFKHGQIPVKVISEHVNDNCGYLQVHKSDKPNFYRYPQMFGDVSQKMNI